MLKKIQKPNNSIDFGLEKVGSLHEVMKEAHESRFATYPGSTKMY